MKTIIGNLGLNRVEFKIVTIEELIKDRREEILRIAARHGAHNVRVFGSVVRGEARPDASRLQPEKAEL